MAKHCLKINNCTRKNYLSALFTAQADGEKSFACILACARATVHLSRQGLGMLL